MTGKKLNPKKIVGIVFLVIMVANFLLFIFTVIPPGVFWAFTALCAAVAWLLLPKMEG
ncbi:MAG: hypothetical protein ABIC95_01030 [archaeon]